MDLIKIGRFTLISLVLYLLNVQCTSDDAEIQVANCNCQSATIGNEEKDVEAVVVFIKGNDPGGYQGPDMYILSTEPEDFERESHRVGENILVPCDSLSVPTAYRKAGLRVIVSYKRKVCYGAITQPYFRSYYGYFVDLTKIKVKNL